MLELSQPPQKVQESLEPVRGALADLNGQVIRYLSNREFSQLERLYVDEIVQQEVNGQVMNIKIGERFVGVRFQGAEYPTVVEYAAFKSD